MQKTTFFAQLPKIKSPNRKNILQFEFFFVSLQSEKCEWANKKGFKHEQKQRNQVKYTIN